MARSTRAQVDVLGTLRVRDPGGNDVTPPGLLQRRVVALLVLRRGHRLPADVLIDALWPTGLPADPVGALQNHLSRVRKLLPVDAVASTGDTYSLDPSSVEVDSDRLATLVATAEVGDPDSATLEEICAILDRWNGPAYPDLLDVDEAISEGVRLAELRTRTREVVAAGRMARGEAREALAELSSLVEDDPLRERPRALLMEALAASGRRAEALRTYDDLRRRLSEELGIDPSTALMARHAALLDGGQAPTPRSARVGRLPEPPLSLIGRDDLIDEVAGLTTTSRLVTLVGPGGVGKTRMLIEVGHRLSTDRPGRSVVLCELAAADDSSVVNVVAAAIGVDSRPGVPLAEQVAAVLDDGELVLLVDNCEHVVGSAAALVDQLLSRCPNLAVVATSRERLRVPGEHALQVPPLEVGSDDDAVQLFVERARAASPGFRPDDADLGAIHEIVRRLDGLPLAIELAAARLFTFDVQEVLAGLDHRFSLLTAGHRTTPRHETLAAAVWWSYELLEESRRDAFTALSVFVTGFTTADAAAVTGLTEPEAAQVLADLAERSLLNRSPGRRYVMLETLRAFGSERLSDLGRSELVADRHAKHMVERLETAALGLLDPGPAAMDEIDASLPELHVALRWSVSRGDLDLAGRLAGAFLDYGLLRLRPDVFEWGDKVTALDPSDRSLHAPRLWVLASYAAWMAGDLSEAERCSAHAMEVALRRTDPVPAEVLTVAGNIAMFSGDLEEAQALYTAAVESADQDANRRLLTVGTELLALGYGNHPRTASQTHAVLDEIGTVRSPYAAYLWYCAGEAVLTLDPALARSRFEEALAIARETGTSFVVGVAGASLTSIDARTGDPRRAADDYRALIDHWRRAGMWSTQWTMLRSIAALLERLGRHQESAVLVGAIRATHAGHRIYGADEVALQELERELRQQLGNPAFEAAAGSGAVLDGDAAIEHALRSL